MNSEGISAFEAAFKIFGVFSVFGVLGRDYSKQLQEVIALDELKHQLSVIIGKQQSVDFVDKIYNEAIQLPGRNYDYMVSKLHEKIDNSLKGL